MPSTQQWLATATLLAGLAVATPTQTPMPAAVIASVPSITPAIEYLARRQLASLTSALGSDASSLDSEVAGVYSSVLTAVGSNLPSYVTGGVLPLEGLPTGTAVQSRLGLNDSAVAALPTQVLNLGPYANWTSQGWNVRFHGNVYKTPNLSNNTLDDFTNTLLIGTSVSNLTAAEQAMSRNLTSEILVIQQGNVQPTFKLMPTPTSGGPQVIQTVYFPYNTTVEGDYDSFVPIEDNSIYAGNATDQIQKVDVYTNGASLGNASAYLVPATGVTIVSDIDDILRVTKIYEPEQGILNTFAYPFVPWMNMPQIYANWSESLLHPQVHFHYLTTTPEQITRNYEAFISSYYPPGSFDTRPLNFSDISATLSIREFLLTKIFETFPQRRFILVADTSNSDVMRDYPKMAHAYNNTCVLLRNTSATDSGDRFPYDTSGFAGLPQNRFMFFRTPADLMGLDISNGQCYNASVPQNVTFGYQGLPLGLSGNGNVNLTASSASASSAAASSASKSAASAASGASKTAASASASSTAKANGAVSGLVVSWTAWAVMVAVGVAFCFM